MGIPTVEGTAMTTKRIALLTFLALGLPGCGVMEKLGLGEPRPAPCNQSVCHVEIVVSDCRVTVVPVDIPVARGNRDMRIIWKVVTQDAEFTPDGIDIQGGGGVFHGKLHQGKLFKWENRNPGPGRFKYNVNVIQAGRTCPSHDPFIVNL